MKEWFYLNFEHLYNSIKFLGWWRGIIVAYHFMVTILFYKNKKNGSYKFYGLAFIYQNSSSLIELFHEIFTHSPYYFKTNKSDPFIVDIGANIGDSLLYFKFLYPEAKIIAFEPHPDAFNLLKKNIQINNFKNVEAIPMAIGDKKGSISLYSDDSSNFRASGGNKDFIKRFLDRDASSLRLTKPLKVPIERLSQSKSINQVKEIDLLKIDAEGSEASILHDADKSGLLKKVRQIILEYHYTFGRKDNSFDLIASILHKNQFAFGIFNYYRHTSNTQDDLTLMLVAKQKNLR